MKKFIIISVALLLASTAMAQTITPRQEREIYNKAYDLVKTYAKVSQLGDDRTATQFYDLFESPNIRICNDLMSLSNKPDLSVSEYVNLLGQADMVSVELKNVNKVNDIYEDDGLLKLTLTFLKSISFVSPCNSFFDSHDFFGKDYSLQMTIVYNPADGECKISELRPVGERLVFPSDYRVLMKYDSRDDNLDINGKYFKFLKDQKVLRPSDRLYYRGAKVQEKDMEGQCDHKVYALYNDKSWRVRLNGGFAVGKFNQFDQPNDVSATDKMEMSFGLDVGYVFPTTSHLRFGVFAGLGASTNSLELSMTKNEVRTNNLTDVDGDTYNRIYQGVGSDMTITQTLNATNISVPVYMDMEYEFNSIFSAYVDAGIKLALKGGTADVTNTPLTISGEYKQYKDPAGNPLVIDQYINNFGSKGNNYLQPGIESSMAIDALVGIGARVNITKSIAVDAGIQYLAGITDSWKSTIGPDIFRYEHHDISDLNGGTDYANLCGGNIKHSALKVNISLIYKF